MPGMLAKRTSLSLAPNHRHVIRGEMGVRKALNLCHSWSLNAATTGAGIVNAAGCAPARKCADAKRLPAARTAGNVAIHFGSLKRCCGHILAHSAELHERDMLNRARCCSWKWHRRHDCHAPCFKVGPRGISASLSGIMLPPAPVDRRKPKRIAGCRSPG